MNHYGQPDLGLPFGSNLVVPALKIGEPSRVLER